ncbi:MAG: arginine--tRNA ligase [Holosporaceae bacterium]|jgi:arginyl-tRNA synthetase|nr:arginine--tRNA ligase [Holosporaceae bacterium]
MERALFVYYGNIIKDFVGNEYADLVAVDPPKDVAFGDFSTNIAMILAKKIGKPPPVIANELRRHLESHEDFEDVEVKSPGFVNWRIPNRVITRHCRHMLSGDFGKIDIGAGQRVNIEYVSANPTGPLHAGHARGAVSGDVLANLLAFMGYNVTKEYYINDAGKQVEILARSLYHRYLELFQKAEDKIPDWAYPGEYLVDTAEKLKKKFGDSFLEKNKDEWLPFFKEFAVLDMMENIKADLKELGIRHDVFSSELKNINSGAIENAIDFLRSKGLIYAGILDVPKGKEPDDWEARKQLLFRSTAFGDDVDRPLQKSDESWTYFASDIAYHLDKITRGFDIMINFWGADHGGYVKRMQSAVSALSDGRKKLDVKIVQLVRFMQNGQEFKMSKRAGTFVTVRDIIEKVGKDVVRFIMLTRRDDAPLDFDFQKVVEQSRDNPVFYVQYAYARTHSVMKQFFQTFNGLLPHVDNVNLDLLDTEAELLLLKTLADWPRQLVMAAKNREPHRLAFYLAELASKFHFLWNQGKDNAMLKFVLADDFEKTAAKMILVMLTQNVIELAFEIIGITPLRELR